MLEDILGAVGWPAAVVAVAIVIAVTIHSNFDSDNQTKFKVACVQAGGSLGESNGWPTCTGVHR